MRFLPIEVPFHSSYLNGCTKLVLDELDNDPLWAPTDLKVPVFNTEDGILF
jgi:fatty acid synthase subunit beta